MSGGLIQREGRERVVAPLPAQRLPDAITPSSGVNSGRMRDLHLFAVHQRGKKPAHALIRVLWNAVRSGVALLVLSKVQVTVST